MKILLGNDEERASLNTVIACPTIMVYWKGLKLWDHAEIGDLSSNQLVLAIWIDINQRIIWGKCIFSDILKTQKSDEIHQGLWHEEDKTNGAKFHEIKNEELIMSIIIKLISYHHKINWTKISGCSLLKIFIERIK